MSNRRVIRRSGIRLDARAYSSQTVWKSKAVFTTSNKREVLLRGAVCSVISWNDIDNAGPKHPVKTLRVFLMLHIRARPCF